MLDPQVVAQLLGRRTRPARALTPREREVLALMAEGRTNAAIAGALGHRHGAVEKNVTSIFQKLLLEDSGPTTAACSPCSPCCSGGSSRRSTG